MFWPKYSFRIVITLLISEKFGMLDLFEQLHDKWVNECSILSETLASNSD